MIKYVAVIALAAVTLAQDFDNFAQSPLSLPPRPAPAQQRPSYPAPAQKAPRLPPVAILKQIDRQNDDGSYTYGYESADGSFKIETKSVDGQIKGKYGYTDDTGKIRVVEYGASSIGFEPVGEGITVPPPTLVDETTDRNGNILPEYSGEDPENPGPAPARANFNIQPSRFAPQSNNRAPVLQQSSNGFEYTAPQFNSAPAPRPAPQAPSQFNFNEAARSAYIPAPRPAATAPLRPVAIPGAQPAPINEPRGLDSYARPSPALQFQPAPQQQLQFAAAPRVAQPVVRPYPARPAAPAYRPGGGFGGGAGGGSILDQLSKDFALPSGGNNVLDISFGVGK